MMALDHGKSILKVFNQPEGPRTIEFNSDETICPNKHLYGIWSSEQEAKVVFVGIESSNMNHQLVIGDALVVDSISYKFMYGILNSTTMDTVLYCAIQGGGKVELAAGELDSMDKQVRVQRNPDNGLNWLLKLFSKFPSPTLSPGRTQSLFTMLRQNLPQCIMSPRKMQALSVW